MYYIVPISPCQVLLLLVSPELANRGKNVLTQELYYIMMYAKIVLFLRTHSSAQARTQILRVPEVQFKKLFVKRQESSEGANTALTHGLTIHRSKNTRCRHTAAHWAQLITVYTVIDKNDSLECIRAFIKAYDSESPQDEKRNAQESQDDWEEEIEEKESKGSAEDILSVLRRMTEEDRSQVDSARFVLNNVRDILVAVLDGVNSGVITSVNAIPVNLVSVNRL